MWKCKECGDEIICDVSGWGFVDKNGQIEEAQDFELEKYRCSECGAKSENLEEIAVWED